MVLIYNCFSYYLNDSKCYYDLYSFFNLLAFFQRFFIDFIYQISNILLLFLSLCLMDLQVFRDTNYCQIFYSQTIFCDYTYSHGNCSYLFICVCSTTQSNFKSYISKFLTAYQFLFEYKRQIKGDIQYIIRYFSTLHLPIYDLLCQSQFHI